MLFIDLQKSYDSVDRELLWRVLKRVGVPAEMLAVFRRFHDGMRVGVRVHYGEDSGCFDVEQQGL